MTAVDLFTANDGDPEHPAVVLLGSLGSTHRMWDPQIASLAGDHQVIRPDLRGHGRSPVPTGPYAINDLASDVVALLDRHGIHQAHVVGLSLGGMIAMDLAASNPDRVSTLTLVCTSAHLGPRQAWTERATLVRAHGTAAVSSAVIARWLTPDFAAGHPDDVALMRQMVENTPAEGYASCCEAIADMDLRDELGAIAVPTLVCAGADDPSTGPAHLRAIADAVPDATYLELSPAAHLASWERSQKFNDALRAHVRTD